MAFSTCTKSYNQQLYLVLEHSTAPKGESVPTNQFLPIPLAVDSGDHTNLSSGWTYLLAYTTAITQYMTFCVGFSLGIMFRGPSVLERGSVFIPIYS